MFNLETIELPILGFRGLEADLTEEEQAIQEVAHRFAEEVMRPIGEKLDKMTPEEVVAEGSPLHDPDYFRGIGLGRFGTGDSHPGRIHACLCRPHYRRP
jgi:hypothetical protein